MIGGALGLASYVRKRRLQAAERMEQAMFRVFAFQGLPGWVIELIWPNRDIIGPDSVREMLVAGEPYALILGELKIT